MPAWEAGIGDGNDVGGLVAAILAPTGGFGKFLLMLLSLTAPSACAPTMYTVCMSFMTVHRSFARLPRFVVATVSTIVCVLNYLLGVGCVLTLLHADLFPSPSSVQTASTRPS